MVQEMNLEQRVNDLTLLNGYSAVNQFRKNEDKEKYQNYQMIGTLGKILDKKADLLMNETPAAVNKEVVKYLGIDEKLNDEVSQKRVKDVGEAIERQKDFLIDSYAKSINENLISKTVEEMNKKQSKQGISEEQKADLDKMTELAVYQNVGIALSSLNLNKEYGDKEAQGLYNELKSIFKLKTDDEKEVYVRDRSIKESGLSSNAQNFRVKWNGNNELNMLTSAYARDLGKRFVKKTSYGYEINQDELKKAFGNGENYLDIALMTKIKE